MYLLYLLYSPVHGHLGCVPVLAVVNSASTNIGMHLYFQIRSFAFSGYMPSGVIAESYGNSSVSFFCFVFCFFEEPPYSFL